MAKKNAELGFALVEKIANAQKFQEILILQTKFVKEQMQALCRSDRRSFNSWSGKLSRSCNAADF